jgi:hypothetical protein
MTDHVIEPGATRPSGSFARPTDRMAHKVGPVEIARWMKARGSRISERWLAEVLSRESGVTPEVEPLLERFLELMVSFLPASLGPYHEQVDPLWRQAAELYGNVGAMRGLAAGEVIEEFQLLRESMLRLLHAEPPGDGSVRLPLRELLLLNRTIDRGVTHASIAHTDVLFFALFQGSGAPETLTPEALQEVHDQLTLLEREFHALMRLLD